MFHYKRNMYHAYFWLTSTCKKEKKKYTTNTHTLSQGTYAYLNLGEREKCVKDYLSKNDASWKYIKTKQKLLSKANTHRKILFYLLYIKKHTSSSSFKYNSNCTLTKKDQFRHPWTCHNRIHYILLCWYCTWNGFEVRHSKNKVI